MRVAIADQDVRTTNCLKHFFEGMGYNAILFTSGGQLITQLQRDVFDLLILGWRLSDRAGLDVLQWASDNLPTVPLMIMTNSSGNKEDITAALHGGADDYMVLPLDPDIMQARIAALLRRSGGRGPSTSATQRFGRYCFGAKQASVELNDRKMELTAKEFALALLLFQNIGRGLSRAYLSQTIWNSVTGLPSRTLDMHVSRIRAKLQLEPTNGFGLVTIFGYGYRLDQCGEDGELP